MLITLNAQPAYAMRAVYHENAGLVPGSSPSRVRSPTGSPFRPWSRSPRVGVSAASGGNVQLGSALDLVLFYREEPMLKVNETETLSDDA